MQRVGCPETSVRNYHYTLFNFPEERRSHLLRDGSLKSGNIPLSHVNLFFNIQIQNLVSSFTVDTSEK